MDVLRLCSPIIAAAVVGGMFSAPALFARPTDANALGNDPCVQIAGDISASGQSGNGCHAAPVNPQRDARPQ